VRGEFVEFRILHNKHSTESSHIVCARILCSSGSCTSHSSERGKRAGVFSAEELLEDKYEQGNVQGTGGKEIFRDFVLTASMVTGFCFRL
jgi:hypothetical protein